mmetsp:Transcript_81854/g.144835  ORF Transcript_81854/g.144835 Transcript_81854/m.144835 type:complete len:537 (-) Transcript_81854:2-1612(-)
MSLRCLILLSRLFLTLVAAHNSSAKAPERCTQDVQNLRLGADEAYLDLLQMHARLRSVTDTREDSERGSRNASVLHATRQKPVCREMTDQGPYHTIAVEVGTPAQEFNLVVDTGSNSFIVPDCKCILSGSCAGLRNCFRSRDSASFQIDTIPNTGGLLTKVWALHFGSGQIDCVLGTDVARLGNVKGIMEKSIYLMKERMLTTIPANFEGLFGLGRPRSPSAVDDPTMLRNLFMKMAGVDRYSLCFNAAGETGSFWMNVPELVNPMGSIGDIHWAFDLQGVSVGSTEGDMQLWSTGAGKALFCSPETKEADQHTACNAVPDSGTTMLAGPVSQIHKLFAAVCRAWPRCVEYHSQHPELTGSRAFQGLLSRCRGWMTEADGLDEIPPISFHLAGIDGKKQIVSLPAWSWVGETPEPVFNFIQHALFGNASERVFPDPFFSGEYCSVMFQAHDQILQTNGPEWILGSPFFYEKVVSFDISVKPPLIAVSDSPCSACDSGAMFKDGVPMAAGAGRTTRRTLRRLDVLPRSPRWESGMRL